MDKGISEGGLPWVVAISGASGTIYGRRLVQVLSLALPEQRIEVVISDSAFTVMREEEGLELSSADISSFGLIGEDAENVVFHDNADMSAAIASGSYRTKGMVVIPCSMATLAAIACGCSRNLMHRAADVCMKEGRKLIVVPRETPLSAIHLENMLSLARMGVSIIPAMPGFYNRPTEVMSLVDMLVMRVLDVMGFEIDLTRRWGELSV